MHDRFRPKHQVLVLKCYPRTTKGAVDVKPNSSELSYLLFYATSRRSKIQKIGAFLEKKTSGDVSHMRIGNVQVTLGILAALVEKSPKDAALIAPCVLNILDMILRSGDITLVESSLPTFEAFCEHHDASSLFGDHEYLRKYQSVVRSYAHLAASGHQPSKQAGAAPVSTPMQFRWRNAGLDAIKHIAASPALSSVSGRQIDTIVPIILDNLSAGDDDQLSILLDRVQVEDRTDPEKPLHRRMSVNTVRTADTKGDTNPVALSGTAVDVDNLAEEDTAVKAAQCLKSIFAATNKAQIYAATCALLLFVSQKVSQGESLYDIDKTTGSDAGWAIRIYDMIARWAPVQDRYVILLATLDMANKTTMREEHLPTHLTFAAMVQSLLRSDLNLIGLSVMDMLLGLVKQIKKLLHMHTGTSGPESSQSDEKTDTEAENSTRSLHDDLLRRLEECISDLATHVYYADQVTDMVEALLARIKNKRAVSMLTLPQADRRTENGNGNDASVVDATSSQGQSQNLSQQPSADVHFSHSNGRLSALRVIKSIFLVASAKTGMGTNLDLSRNQVPVHVWEGTQWLLRDPNGLVRQAYADALMTWLDREMNYLDQAARDDSLLPHRSATKDGRDMPAARRAVSGASTRERQPHRRHCQFLPLLHLAIYDSALQFVDFDNDIILLHSLLTKLVFKLGVNATRCGIPMIYRLQEDIQELEEPIHKVRVAALCHGYFWALAEKFDFEGSVVGRAVYNEITRRKSKSFWVEGVHVPAPQIGQIGQPGKPRPQPDWDPSTLETEEILPFDDRSSMVDCIQSNYEETTLSAPGSPAASPGRVAPNSLSVTAHSTVQEKSAHLPLLFKDQMLAEWSRDSALAAITAAGKSESLSGSRTGTTVTGHNKLTLSMAALNGNGHVPDSPVGGSLNLRPMSSQPQGNERALSMSKLRKLSVASVPSQSGSPAGKGGGIASVEQLKLILAGQASAQSAGIPGTEDDSDESLLSYDYEPSEHSFQPSAPPPQPTTTGEALARTLSASASVRSRGTHDGSPAPPIEEGDDDGVPPVPPLPNLSSLSGKIGSLHGSASIKRSISSRVGDKDSVRAPSLQYKRATTAGSQSMDLNELLRGIDSRSGEVSLGNLTRPPY